MCLAAAYTMVEGDKPVLRDIARMRLDGDSIELETLLGEKRVLQGKVTEVDFMNSKVTIEQ